MGVRAWIVLLRSGEPRALALARLEAVIANR
jgi:hypothetical protein